MAASLPPNFLWPRIVFFSFVMLSLKTLPNSNFSVRGRGHSKPHGMPLPLQETGPDLSKGLLLLGGHPRSQFSSPLTGRDVPEFIVSSLFRPTFTFFCFIRLFSIPTPYRSRCPGQGKDSADLHEKRKPHRPHQPAWHKVGSPDLTTCTSCKHKGVAQARLA